VCLLKLVDDQAQGSDARAIAGAHGVLRVVLDLIEK
jgi:hypothetical protein